MIEVLAGSYPLWHDLAKRTIEISWGRTLIATMAMAMRVRPDSVRLLGVLVSNATTTLPTGPAIVPRYILLEPLPVGGVGPSTTIIPAWPDPSSPALLTTDPGSDLPDPGQRSTGLVVASYP